MKKVCCLKGLFCLIVPVLLGIGAGNAYAADTESGKLKVESGKWKEEQPVIIIVMDSTQALLDHAVVKFGKQVLETSFDGRVVIAPEAAAGVKTFEVLRNDYLPIKWKVESGKWKVESEKWKEESGKWKVENGNTIIVVMTPKRSKPEREKGGKDAEMYYSVGAAAGVRYVKSATARPTVDYADGVYESEDPVPTPMLNGASSAGAPSAGKLTAGEVNDFAKWNLWRGVIDGSHKEFTGTWHIAPRDRYTVQVKTRSGAPVASRAVSLTDGQGNTLFQAVTDNTGKAELWSNLIPTLSQQAATGLQVRVDKQVIPAKPWSEGVNVIELDEACETSDGVDVVFVFDATGSMGDELRYLQAEMKDVIDRAAQATGGLAIRTGAVVYRDHGDDYVTRISRLTDDIKTTQAFIDKQSAYGGGDYPEAIPEALMAALNSAGWDADARARVAFLVLDAPCHEDSATLARLHDQVLNAAASGVRIVPVVCSGLEKSGEYLLRAIALATNGTSFFLTDDSGIGHSHLKPTTDSLKVEHLNDMLVRTIVEFSLMPACERVSGLTDERVSGLTDEGVDGQFVPNPFSAQDLAADPTIPHGEGVHYLVDVTGKLLGVFEGEVQTDWLPTGIYFVKTFIDGQWLTKKLFVR